MKYIKLGNFRIGKGLDTFYKRSQVRDLYKQIKRGLKGNRSKEDIWIEVAENTKHILENIDWGED